MFQYFIYLWRLINTTIMTVDLSSPVNRRKALNLVLGAASLAVGLFSHFQSHWVKIVQLKAVVPKTSLVVWVPTYRMCELVINEKACPNIALEQCYVAVIIVCFVLSIVNFLLGVGLDLEESPYKFVDRIYHILSALVLLIAGSLYILSSCQIYKLLDLKNGEFRDEIPFKFRTYEKWASGGLAILQAIAYAMTPTVRKIKLISQNFE